MNSAENAQRFDEVDKIILIILTQINPYFVSALSGSLKITFNRHVEVRFQVTSLGYAYDSKRKQYISPRVLSRLRRLRRDSLDKILGIADVDMYSPGYDFIYGEADIEAGVATLSINRLVSDKQAIQPALDLSLERIIREATHEVGHLFGLLHCSNSKCVMRTCTCLAEVDAANDGLCAVCADRLEAKTEERPASHGRETIMC
jgi:archaemetzincin